MSIRFIFSELRTMKHLLFFLLLSSTAAFAQPENEIRQVLNAQQKAWNSGSLEGFMQYYWKSDSLRFMTKERVTWGWDATLKRYQKGYPDKASMGKLDFDILSVELLSDRAALVTGKWSVAVGTESESGHFNLLLKKIHGDWKIVLDHTS